MLNWPRKINVSCILRSAATLATRYGHEIMEWLISLGWKTKTLPPNQYGDCLACNAEHPEGISVYDAARKEIDGGTLAPKCWSKLI